LKNVETKLAAARTRLILENPFLGALVLRMPMVATEGQWCKTSATDAKSIFYNYEFVNELSLGQTQFLLAHEALHCALSHFARRHHRDRARWDIACDLAINPLLLGEGLSPTPNAIFLTEFEGMTAEEIYPMLDEHEHLEPQDDHIYDSDESEGGQSGQGDGEQREGSKGGQESGSQPQQGENGNKPPPLTPEEKDQLSVQWSQRMAGAAQSAMQAGKMSGILARMIEHLLQPQLPWRMLLARYMTATARNDYNYSRPSRRDGDAIMPSLKSHELKVVVAVDTSGSISDDELEQFISEVNAIKSQANARITLLACDSEVDNDGPWEYEQWEEFILPKEFPGGGSTDFTPVFNWIDDQTIRPDLAVYFTDANGKFPGFEPSYPVLWLVKGKTQVPWGQRIQLN
jgi:predicted metal-dependent peptidase